MKLLRTAIAVLFLAAPVTLAQASTYGDSKSVKSLQSLLTAHPDLKDALEKAMKAAKMDGIATILDFESYINGIVRLVPTNRNIEDKLAPLYIITEELSDERELVSVFPEDAGFQATQSCRHCSRAAVRLSLKLSRL